MSANYVMHTGSSAALGAIQLCKFPRVIAGSTKWYAFGRIQMYSPLAAQQWANAWLYINTNGTYRTYTCDDHGSPQAHVTQGETTCWTPAYWVSGGQTFQATGRAYRSNGSGGWTLFADGATLACYLNGCI